jgi:hypothetical protein
MTPLDSTSAAPKSDRDVGGRFAAGNKGGPGNPFNRRVAHLKRLFLEAVTDDDIVAVAHDIVLKARSGDLAASKLMLQYALGKPGSAVEPDRVEVEEHRLRQEATVPFEAWAPRVGDLPAETVNRIWDVMGPENEASTLAPLISGAIEAEKAGGTKKATRKATRRAIRTLEAGGRPSANGFNGGEIEDLIRRMKKQRRDSNQPPLAG